MILYRDELTRAMTILGQHPRTLFIGQNTVYGGAVDIPPTLAGVPAERKIEFPVAEDLQMGVCIGLALTGWLPVCIYPRMDFLLLAFNQLVNHLDKLPEMSAYRYQPKVIIRVGVGALHPLDPGPQHRQNYSIPLSHMLTTVDVRLLERAEDIVPMYKGALESKRSTLLVEYQVQMR